jgi:hypothetical protein
MKKATFFILSVFLSFQAFAKNECFLRTKWSYNNSPLVLFDKYAWPNLNIPAYDTVHINFSVHCDSQPYRAVSGWVIKDSLDQVYTSATGEYYLLPGAYRIYDITGPNYPCGHFQIVDTSATLHVPEFIPTGISVYPNPFGDFLTVKMKGGNTAELQIRIFSLDGRLVLEHTYTEISSCTLVTSALPAGVYIAEIRTKENTITQKLLKTGS